MPERKATQSEEKIVRGENNGFSSVASRLSPAVVQKFHGKSKEVKASYIRTFLICVALCKAVYHTCFDNVESEVELSILTVIVVVLLCPSKEIT
jgi:hypothetical protein